MEDKLNLSFNRSINAIPYMIAHKKNPFTNEDFSYDKESIVNQIKMNSEKSLAFRNKSRITFLYRVNDLIFLKNQSPDKVEDKFCGPFKIIEVSNDLNRVLIDDGLKEAWINIKNI